MSLRTRINVLFAFILTMGLVIDIGSMVLDAGRRVRDEDDSTVRLAKDLVESELLSLAETPDPGAALNKLMDGLGNLRHVSIFVAGDNVDAARLKVPVPAEDSEVPLWFVQLVHPERTVLTVPVNIGGRDYGEIVIASDPLDEMDEIWEAIRSLALGGIPLICLGFAFNSWVVGHSIKIISVVGRAMAKLEAGDYDVRVAPAGPPELVDVCHKVNSLAAALSEATRENSRLALKVITLQDDERRELARELHDEFGPYLFSIRVNATSLLKAAERSELDAPRLRQTSASMLEQVDSLQKVNRRVLGRLLPIAYADLGLEEALRALVAMWQGSHPDVGLTMSLPDDLDHIDQAIGLAVYRIVQEGLTNAYRHANPTHVDVVVETGSNNGDDGAINASAATIKTAAASPREVRVRLRDNGRGVPVPLKQGFGLVGMGERVRALRGRMKIGNLPDGGVMLEASLPLG